jgi:hypothetical protein
VAARWRDGAAFGGSGSRHRFAQREVGRAAGWSGSEVTCCNVRRMRSLVA